MKCKNAEVAYDAMTLVHNVKVNSFRLVILESKYTML